MNGSSMGRISGRHAVRTTGETAVTPAGPGRHEPRSCSIPAAARYAAATAIQTERSRASICLRDTVPGM
jgi:hypothetical protein